MTERTGPKNLFSAISATARRALTAQREQINLEISERRRGDHHTRCHNCGRFLEKSRWIRKDHPSKRHALCWDCYNNYDDPLVDNAL